MASSMPGRGWGLPTWASCWVGLVTVSPSPAGPGSLQCRGCQERELHGAVSVLVHLCGFRPKPMLTGWGGPKAGLGPT